MLSYAFSGQLLGRSGRKKMFRQNCTLMNLWNVFSIKEALKHFLNIRKHWWFIEEAPVNLRAKYHCTKYISEFTILHQNIELNIEKSTCTISKRPKEHFIFAVLVYTWQLLAEPTACILWDCIRVLRIIDSVAATGCHDEPFCWQDVSAIACSD